MQKNKRKEKKKNKQRKEGKLSTYKNKPNSTHLHIQPYTVYFAMFTKKPSTYCNGKLLENINIRDNIKYNFPSVPDETANIYDS